MDVCFQVLKESNKRRFDSLQCQEQCIDHNSHYLVACIFFPTTFLEIAVSLTQPRV